MNQIVKYLDKEEYDSVCEFHIMHPNFTLSLYALSTLATSPHKRKENLFVEAVMYHTLYTLMSTLPANVHCIGSKLWLLLHNQYWILSWTLLNYPVVVLCHRDPEALDL